MAKFLFVWEMGANLGHLDRMLVAARALKRRGHGAHFLLRELSRAQPRLAPHGFAFGQAPVWLPRLANPPRLMNYAAVLAAAGWMDATGLVGLLCGWRDALSLIQPDGLVCDHAPTALLAVHSLPPAQRPRAVWALGNSWEVPPLGECFPSAAPDDPAEPARCPSYDATVLPVVNAALARLGAPALQRLTDLFALSHRAVATLPELAHYEGYGADTPALGPMFADDVGEAPAWPDAPAGTPRVFAYLDPTHPAFDAVTAALKSAGVAAWVHAKGLSSAAAQRLAGPRLRFSPQPLRLRELLPACDVVIDHASLGVATAALLAGKPQLVLPTHTEQGLVARRMRRQGLALEIPLGDRGGKAGALLQRLLTDPAYANAARAVADRHAGASPHATGERVAEMMEASLQAPSPPA